jgi:hypothetical protein
MSEPARVLLVAHQTAATAELLDAVRERAARGPASFHLVVPKRPHGLHKILDPEDTDADEARAVLDAALPKLSHAAGLTVTGEVGGTEPLMAIHDAVNLKHFDEIIISTLPLGISRWLRLDLVSKARGLGLPVMHVLATAPAESLAEIGS